MKTCLITAGTFLFVIAFQACGPGFQSQSIHGDSPLAELDLSSTSPFTAELLGEPASEPAPNVGQTSQKISLISALNANPKTIKPRLPTSLKSSGPITVSSNQVISGLRISNPNGPCLQLKGAHNVKIENNHIGPCKDFGILAEDSNNLLIQNNYIEKTRGEVIRGQKETGSSIRTKRGTGIRIFANYMSEAYAAIRVFDSKEVKVLLNTATDIRGAYPMGQFVQFIGVQGTGNQVNCNVSDQTLPNLNPSSPWSSGAFCDKKTGGSHSDYSTPRTEDHINIYKSHGTNNSPIQVSWNRIRGGSSCTGSGIMAGDGGGGDILVENNTVVNPFNTGIGVAGGTNITVQRNRIYQGYPGQIANEGMYIVSQDAGRFPCSQVIHKENQVQWAPENRTTGWTVPFKHIKDGQYACQGVSGTNTNKLYEKGLSESIYEEVPESCRQLASQLFGEENF